MVFRYLLCGFLIITLPVQLPAGNISDTVTVSIAPYWHTGATVTVLRSDRIPVFDLKVNTLERTLIFLVDRSKSYQVHLKKSDIIFFRGRLVLSQIPDEVWDMQWGGAIITPSFTEVVYMPPRVDRLPFNIFSFLYASCIFA